MNLEMHFFIDGPQLTQQLNPEWKIRYTKNVCRQEEIVTAICFAENNHISDEGLIRPALIEQAILENLRSLSVGITYCSKEADGQIAKFVQDNKQIVLSVLSRDSDFLIFEEIPYTPWELFDIYHNLSFSDQAGVNEITLGRFNSSRLCKFLKITHNKLIQLTVLRGNDFSKYLVREKYRHLFRELTIESCAHILGKSSDLNQISTWKELCRNEPEARDFLKSSISFYKLLDLKAENIQSPLLESQTCKHLWSNYELGKLSSQLVGMCYGVFWHRIILEKPFGTKTIDKSMEYIRSFLYGIFLQKDIVFVSEQGGVSNAT
ncbi:MAG: 3'-5' RNA helicase ythdc2, partial [Paramarteilia canceri]